MFATSSSGITTVMNVHPPSQTPVIPTYGVMNEEGELYPGAQLDPDLNQDKLLHAYRMMVRNAVMDTVLYDSQRQGRISFYLTAFGEEAASVASSMALNPQDEMFAQYREVGALLVRGYTPEQVVDQCCSTEDDPGKGRMMPVHYGTPALRFQTISSPLATQIPQAAGAAYAHKVGKTGLVSICYFGDGAASEGDFHAGLNIAATTGSPCIFFCRNNLWAISTPTHEQFRGDGIAGRGIALGMHTIRVDGSDFPAVYAATKAARAIALGGQGGGSASSPPSSPSPTGPMQPVLVEAMTYRESHHSTSDDSTRYRSAEEIEGWRLRSNPLRRLRAFLEKRGWWSEGEEEALVAAERKDMLAIISRVEAKPKVALQHMFTDVYDKIPPRLAKQEREVFEHAAQFPPASH